MKRKTILTIIISLVLTAAIQAQTKPDYAGRWELDTVKSKLPGDVLIESMTLKVKQTDKELKVESMSKHSKGDARGGMTRLNVSQSIIYSLEGKETTIDVTGGKEIRRAVQTPNGNLNLTVTRSTDRGTGDITIKTNEIWELIDGKTLKVTRYTEAPRGATNTEMYFTKTSSNLTLTISDVPANNSSETLKTINGGVLNGKAISLPKPAYPLGARAMGAKGSVNVKITIDEAGNVISAEAVSGDALLREVCVEAARKARFNPTTLGGKPVKVTGIVVYNFVP
jgi:TonB family protein